MGRRWLIGATVATALTLAVSGCSGPSTSASSTTVAAPSDSPASPSTATPSATPAAVQCVADPQSVITRTLPEAATRAMPAPTAEAIDKAATEALAQAATAGAIVAVRSPEGTHVKAYGLADQATNTPMATEMHHRIGSLTKTFTGTLVLQLAQEGLLSLDDPISKHFDGIPRGEDITIRMLLNMTSGIASYSQDPEFQKQLFGQPDKRWTPDELLTIGLDLPRKFEPGAQFDYSNTNTILLGLLIENLTDTAYAEALQTRIFDPLQLKSTSMPGEDGALPSPHATGLTLQGLPEGQTTPQNATSWNPSWGWSAGELTSTASDLLVYGRAMSTGQGLVDAKTQTERLTFPEQRGYGLAVGCIDGWLGHTGEQPGFNSTLFYDTRSDTTVAVLANSDIPSGSCTQSRTLPDSPKDLPCMDPATRIFTAVSTALGQPFTPNPKS